MRQLTILLWFVAYTFWLGVANAQVEYAINKEYAVKAAIVYNLTKFVEWPGDWEVSNQSRVNICVIGNSELLNTGEIFRAASTPKLTLSLVKIDRANSTSQRCHIVFIGRGESGNTETILAQLKNSPVLTVSDTDNFVERGGMIGMLLVEGHVKLAVNLRSAQHMQLRVDAQLLELAHKVIDKE